MHSVAQLRASIAAAAASHTATTLLLLRSTHLRLRGDALRIPEGANVTIAALADGLGYRPLRRMQSELRARHSASALAGPTIDAEGRSRVFEVRGNLRLESVKLIGGRVTDESWRGPTGGGIHVSCWRPRTSVHARTPHARTSACALPTYAHVPRAQAHAYAHKHKRIRNTCSRATLSAARLAHQVADSTASLLLIHSTIWDCNATTRLSSKPASGGALFVSLGANAQILDSRIDRCVNAARGRLTRKLYLRCARGIASARLAEARRHANADCARVLLRGRTQAAYSTSTLPGAAARGGGVAVENGGVVSMTRVMIVNCTVSANAAQGGGVLLGDGRATVHAVLEDTVVEACSAMATGRAYELSGVTTVPLCCKAGVAQGGGLGVLGPVSATLLRAEVVDCLATGYKAYGGGIRVVGPSAVSLAQSQVARCEVIGAVGRADGGGIDVWDPVETRPEALRACGAPGAGCSPQLELTQSVIADCKSSTDRQPGRKAYGAGLTVRSGIVTLVGSTVAGCAAQAGRSRGGAIFAQNARATISHSIIEGNVARSFSFADEADLSKGGGLYSIQSEVSLTASTFNGNEARWRSQRPEGVGHGHAFHLTSSSARSEIFNCSITRTNPSFAIVADGLLSWRCRPGSFMPLVSTIHNGEMVGCPYRCALGYFGDGSNHTDFRCRGYCPLGHFCTEGTALPTPCPPGEHAPYRGTSVCQQCGVGLYSDGPGARQCTVCARGTFSSEPGAVRCAPCPPGGYCSVEGAASASQAFEPYASASLEARPGSLVSTPPPPFGSVYSLRVTGAYSWRACLPCVACA